MRRLFILLLVAMPFDAYSAEKRCGWLENPTPGNLWLIDADAEWIISTQGVGFADEKSMEHMPKIDEKEFVRTNGYYGFSCVCLDVKTSKAESRILKVYKGKQLLLKQCLEDPAINTKIPLR